MDNQENNADNQPVTNKQSAPVSTELTDANWVFLRHLQKGYTIVDAYEKAGYTGKDKSAPYVLYSKLKSKLGELVESDGFNKTRLAIEMQKLLDLPLAQSVKEVSLTEKLKSIRLANTILTENAPKNAQNQFTMIVINTEPEKPIVDTPNGPSGHEVIDAEVVKEDNGPKDL